MKVIVTGGAGFIGSHLVDELINLGMDVHIIDNLSIGTLSYVNSKATIHQVAIESDQAAEIILTVKPDYVFHLAAQASVNKSLTDFQFDAEVNIMGTLNLLHASYKAGVKKFIFASTSAIYGDYQTDLLQEDDQKNPISFYGMSKLTAESYIKLFYKLYGLPYTILRFSNVYGPRQSGKGEGGVIAIFFNKIKNNEPLTIYGDGEQTRDFIYVKDLVQANIAAMTNGVCENIHISTAETTSVNQLVSILEKINDRTVQKNYIEKRNGDIEHSCLSNQRALEQLNWKPKVCLCHGLLETHMYIKNESTEKKNK